jgi:hypothetical protein
MPRAKAAQRKAAASDAAGAGTSAAGAAGRSNTAAPRRAPAPDSASTLRFSGKGPGTLAFTSSSSKAMLNDALQADEYEDVPVADYMARLPAAPSPQADTPLPPPSPQADTPLPPPPRADADGDSIMGDIGVTQMPGSIAEMAESMGLSRPGVQEDLQQMLLKGGKGLTDPVKTVEVSPGGCERWWNLGQHASPDAARLLL